MSSPARQDSVHAQEAQILARIAQGDQSALGELYDRWSAPLQAIIGTTLQDPGQIEDTLHDVFINLWQKASDFNLSPGSTYDWAVNWVRANTPIATGSPLQPAASAILPPPSAGLRARILNSAVPLPPETRYTLPFPTPPAWLGWTAASLFGFTAIFFAGKSFNVRGDMQAAIEAERVTRIEAGTLKNLLEAERILSRGQLDRLLAADRLIVDLRVQTDLSRFNLAPLTAPVGSETKTLGSVMWSPDRPTGVMVAVQLPEPPADRVYKLWIIDSQAAAPSEAGTLTVDATTGAGRVNFKLAHALTTAPVFTVTLEGKNPSTTPTGPVVLTSVVK